MLDILRANARSALTYVLFGIIIVVFVVSFGPGSCGGPGSGARNGVGSEYAAKVNGVTISAAEYEAHYGQLFRGYQRQMGEAFSRDLAERLGLRRIALDQLVDRTLVRQEAQAKGIVVSDEDLQRAITENPAFQSGGQFNFEYYQRAVTNEFGSPARFELQMREELAVQKMVALLRATAKVSEEEIRDAWLSEADRANVEFVRFPVGAARGEVKVTAADAESFAAANPDRVKKAFEEGKARWDQPKRVRARHVLVKADDQAGAAAVEAAQKKAQEILEKARAGEDFAKLAQQSDDAGSKDKGGEVGWFGPGTMAKPFEEAAFGAKKGDLVGPVRTRFGFHVIQVEDVQEAKPASFDSVRVEVARELLEADRAKELARRKADEALAALKAGRSLAELFPADGKKAVRLGDQVLRTEESGSITAAQAEASVPRLGSAPELVRAAFAVAAPQPLGKVFDTATGPVVARVKERQKADAAQFEQKKAEVAERLRARREAEVEQAWIKTLRERGDVKVNDKLAAAPAAER
jgi:peptidyl-prolyl cis-trans isomerase D